MNGHIDGHHSTFWARNNFTRVGHRLKSNLGGLQLAHRDDHEEVLIEVVEELQVDFLHTRVDHLVENIA